MKNKALSFIASVLAVGSVFAQPQLVEKVDAEEGKLLSEYTFLNGQLQ